MTTVVKKSVEIEESAGNRFMSYGVTIGQKEKKRKPSVQHQHYMGRPVTSLTRLRVKPCTNERAGRPELWVNSFLVTLLYQHLLNHLPT
jgi:hypothetical protein